jgi:hypothetical protein
VYHAVHSVVLDGGRVSAEFMADAQDYVNGDMRLDEWEEKTFRRFKARVF